MNWGDEICYEVVFLSLLRVTVIQLPASFSRGLRGTLSYMMDGWMDGWEKGKGRKGRQGGREGKEERNEQTTTRKY